MQINLGNVNIGKNLVLSGNNVYGTNTSLLSFGNTQVVAGGMISGGQVWAF